MNQEFINIFGVAGWGALITYIIRQIIDYKVAERKYKFERLHEKRWEVIEELYKRLVIMEKEFKSLMSPLQKVEDPSQQEKAKSAAKAGNDFLDYFSKKRLYFDKDLVEKIEDFNTKMGKLYNKFQYAVLLEGEEVNVDKWIEIWEEVAEDQVPVLKEEIESDFKDVLGV